MKQSKTNNQNIAMATLKGLWHKFFVQFHSDLFKQRQITTTVVSMRFVLEGKDRTQLQRKLKKAQQSLIFTVIMKIVIYALLKMYW